MRASFFVAGPILARTGYAKVPMPGGCSIGSRPIDIHLTGFKAMGAEIRIEHGFVELKCPKLKGTRMHLDFPSVGATENIMMAATLAQGQTIIENAAREPEIDDLANYLNNAGAQISGIGTSVLTINGVPRLTGCTHRVIADRIEAATLLIAGAITGGKVTVEDAIFAHLEPIVQKMQECGVLMDVDVQGNKITVLKPLILKPCHFQGSLPMPKPK
jgi:UDP-N-acetylglucosamine 1-carboxyvinyltransferase